MRPEQTKAVPRRDGAPEAAELAALVGVFRARALPLDPVPVPALPPAFAALLDAPLPRRPRCILLDIYGTLLASDAGEIGVRREPGAATGPWETPTARRKRLDKVLVAFEVTLGPEEFEYEFKRLVLSAHASAKARGIERAEIDAPALVASITGFDAATARAFCVERECAINASWPMPGAAEFLEAARTSGLSLGIISNAQFYTPLAIEAAFGADPEGLGFDPRLLVWSWELGRAKPDPLPFQRAVERLRAQGLEPEDCVYVGNDRGNDVAPAREAGMMTALFAGDARSLRLRSNEASLAAAMPETVLSGFNAAAQALRLREA